MYAKYIKRLLDFLLSLIALILLSPLGKPAIFKQERPGKNEKIFTLYKFRTMTDEKNENGELLPDEQRLTKFGKLLRSTSLDELPELINIIKGDMAIVGPRPLLVRYLPYYTEEERHRHDVKPGLTGLAQVSGRNLLKWEERFKIDVNYVKNISFKIDMKIFFLTIKKVLLGSDIQPSTDSEGYFDDIRMKEIENGK